MLFFKYKFNNYAESIPLPQNFKIPFKICPSEAKFVQNSFNSKPEQLKTCRPPKPQGNIQTHSVTPKLLLHTI